MFLICSIHAQIAFQFIAFIHLFVLWIFFLNFTFRIIKICLIGIWKIVVNQASDHKTIKLFRFQRQFFFILWFWHDIQKEFCQSTTTITIIMSVNTVIACIYTIWFERTIEYIELDGMFVIQRQTNLVITLTHMHRMYYIHLYTSIYDHTHTHYRMFN